jgi:hypothetical protein
MNCIKLTHILVVGGGGGGEMQYVEYRRQAVLPDSHSPAPNWRRRGRDNRGGRIGEGEIRDGECEGVYLSLT